MQHNLINQNAFNAITSIVHDYKKFLKTTHKHKNTMGRFKNENIYIQRYIYTYISDRTTVHEDQ